MLIAELETYCFTEEFFTTFNGHGHSHEEDDKERGTSMYKRLMFMSYVIQYRAWKCYNWRSNNMVLSDTENG